jgi:ribosomal peptide maturation radical SAM protein 1
MRIMLVSAPWNLLETPSLPLGILSAVAANSPIAPRVEHLYANLAWAEYLLDVTKGGIEPEDYNYVANLGVWHGMGDWVFAPALYDTPGWRREEFTAYLERTGVDPGRSYEMAEHSASFVNLMAEQIVAGGPDLVGFSTTFQQNIASLAIARRLKQLAPGVRTLFGGGNCAGSMGPAIHRNFPYVDYVLSGEAERTFTDLLDHLAGAREVSQVPALSWRAADGSTVVNEPGGMVQMAAVPCPDYSHWFTTFRASPMSLFVRPKLLYEAARGCWWGEKHPCTFCGLNQLTMEFRSRPAEQVLTQLRELVGTYKVLDILSVDNILDLDYLRSLLPRLADQDWDLHFYYEVKSNLRAEDVKALRAAGLIQIQPGIENLSSPVLKIMDKGVHATQNVKLLRDCEENDVTVDWNYLYGFPGETDTDYDVVLAQMAALAHLQPPAGSVRIILERFSPYFTRPELGFSVKGPATFYRHVYDLPESELQEVVYQFATEERGIGEKKATQLRAAIRTWRAAYRKSSLTWSLSDDGSIVITDRRAGWPQRDIRLQPGTESRCYQALGKPRGIPAAAASLGIPTDELTALVDDWLDQGLVFSEGGRVVTLATARASVKSEES